MQCSKNTPADKIRWWELIAQLSLVMGHIKKEEEENVPSTEPPLRVHVGGVTMRLVGCFGAQWWLPLVRWNAIVKQKQFVSRLEPARSDEITQAV